MHVRSRVRTVLGLVACFGAVAFFLGACGAKNRFASQDRTIIVRETGALAVSDAFSRVGPYLESPSGTVRAGILPHHTLAAPIISAFFRGLELQESPRTVVIIGPDHGNLGSAYVTTTKQSWQTPEGLVDVDGRIVDALLGRGLVAIDDQLLEQEHGVSAILPYLRHQFPKARVVQLAVRGDLRSDRLEEMASALRDLVEPNDLVLASVDFSHYKDLIGARADDAISLSAITRGDAEAALSIPVDSPPSIVLLLLYARLRGLVYQELVHTNSAELLGDLSLTSTTSYLSAYFNKN